MFGRRKVMPLLLLMAMVTAGQAQRKASLDDPGSADAGRGVRET